MHVDCLHFELKKIMLSVCRVLAGKRTLSWRCHTPAFKNKLVNFIYHNQVYEAPDDLTPPTLSSICATFPPTLFIPVIPKYIPILKNCHFSAIWVTHFGMLLHPCLEHTSHPLFLDNSWSFKFQLQEVSSVRKSQSLSDPHSSVLALPLNSHCMWWQLLLCPSLFSNGW